MTVHIIYNVHITETCEKELVKIAKHDKNIASKLLDKMEDLAYLPEKKGKPLVGELAGFWSRCVYAGRYRIVYTIDKKARLVEIIYTGIRKGSEREDVYSKLKKKK